LAIVTAPVPNCHDEAQYLVKLDKKYRDKGLAIVALDFEEPDSRKTWSAKSICETIRRGVHLPDRGRTVGDVEKVPQAVNLNTWPQRSSLDAMDCEGIHSGFASLRAAISTVSSKRNSHRRLSSCFPKSQLKIWQIHRPHLPSPDSRSAV